MRMKTNKIIRTCIATQEKKRKDELIRIVKINDEYMIANKKYLYGRSAYVSKDMNLFQIILKKRLLNKTFRTKVPQEIYDKLKKEMQKYENKKQTQK